jgi:signal transduction histidine kinase
MFYRASEKSVGSGLGLYIVKEILNKIDGKLKLISKSRVGTRFYISIPNKYH